MVQFWFLLLLCSKYHFIFKVGLNLLFQFSVHAAALTKVYMVSVAIFEDSLCSFSLWNVELAQTK